MGGLSFWHIIILGAVFLVLFGGRNKISDIMGDVAKGIKSFKKGMSDEEPAAAASAAQNREPVRSLDHQPVTAGSADKTVEVRRVG